MHYIIYFSLGVCAAVSVHKLFLDFHEFMIEEPQDAGKWMAGLAVSVFVLMVICAWPLFIFGVGVGYIGVKLLNKVKAESNMIIGKWIDKWRSGADRIDIPDDEEFKSILLENIGDIKRPMLLKMLATNGFGSYLKDKEGSTYISSELATRDLLGDKT